MPIDARLERMSMYSELLAATLAASSDQTEPPDEDLLRRMAAARALPRVAAERGRPAASDASSSLARELDYDMALIALCRRHGIRCDPAEFTRPGPERARLERELSARGVPVVALVEAAQPAPGRRSPRAHAGPNVSAPAG